MSKSKSIVEIPVEEYREDLSFGWPVLGISEFLEKLSLLLDAFSGGISVIFCLFTGIFSISPFNLLTSEPEDIFTYVVFLAGLAFSKFAESGRFLFDAMPLTNCPFSTSWLFIGEDGRLFGDGLGQVLLFDGRR